MRAGARLRAPSAPAARCCPSAVPGVVFWCGRHDLASICHFVFVSHRLHGRALSASRRWELTLFVGACLRPLSFLFVQSFVPSSCAYCTLPPDVWLRRCGRGELRLSPALPALPAQPTLCLLLPACPAVLVQLVPRASRFCMAAALGISLLSPPSPLFVFLLLCAIVLLVLVHVFVAVVASRPHARL